MDLNNIKLPASLIAELYDSCLIEPGGQQTTIGPPLNAKVESIQEDHRKWLGENRKKILVLVNHQDFVHLPDHELNFLTRILTACHLGLGDIALVNLNGQPELGYKEMIAQFKSKTILLFGVDPTTIQLPMSFPHFQVQEFAGSAFLFSPAVAELEKDEVLKSKLWVCLRRLFNI